MNNGLLHFTQGEKRAVLLLMIFILVFIAGYFSFTHLSPKREVVVIQHDTVYQEPPEKPELFPKKSSSKYTEKVSINLNRADTSQLKKIPGIGPVYAQRIVEYRASLGGFHSLAQLKEVSGIGDVRFAELQKWVYIMPDSHKLIYVNRATFNEMNNHPYFNISLIRPIKTLQQDGVRIESIEELCKITGIKKKDAARLAPYLSFE